MMVAWALLYWLCDDPVTSECRPAPTRAFVLEGDCERAVAAVRADVKTSRAVHCQFQRDIVADTAAKSPPASLHCAGDQVVWVNTHTHVFHVAGSRAWGATKAGKFACRKDAEGAHDRLSTRR